MDTQIVPIFCLCDDLLKGLHHVVDRQSQLSDAEVMTAAIVAMLYFRGNFRMACQFLCEYDYMPHMLSRNRVNRRLHRISELFLSLFLSLGEYWKALNERSSLRRCQHERRLRRRLGPAVGEKPQPEGGLERVPMIQKGWHWFAVP
jgi:hypothetical protein